MNNKYTYTPLIICLIIFFFSSCEKEDVSKNASRLRIKLTDAAAPTIKEMYVDISKIEVFHVDSTGTNGEWSELEYGGGEYELLKLRNGNMMQLTDQYFPAGGMIDKIKITLGNHNRMVTVSDEDIVLHKAPEIREEVVIDNVHALLTPHVIVSIVVDINAALSVYELNGNYYFDPKARAFPETYGGSLKGYVTPVEARPLVLITHEDDSLFSIPEGERGMFFFSGLHEAQWKVHLFADPETAYVDTVFMSDSIIQGRVTEIKPNPIRLVPSVEKE